MSPQIILYFNLPPSSPEVWSVGSSIWRTCFTPLHPTEKRHNSPMIIEDTKYFIHLILLFLFSLAILLFRKSFKKSFKKHPKNLRSSGAILAKFDRFSIGFCWNSLILARHMRFFSVFFTSKLNFPLEFSKFSENPKNLPKIFYVECKKMSLHTSRTKIITIIIHHFPSFWSALWNTDLIWLKMLTLYIGLVNWDFDFLIKLWTRFEGPKRG